jgi:hypothetical protein
MIARRVVLDSSVVIAAMRPSEPGYEDARDFLGRARGAQEREGARVLAPPELWLEVHVAAQKLAKQKGEPEPKDPMAGLVVDLVAMDRREAVLAFLEVLSARMHGQAPLPNATDLVYLWVAWSEDATLITLDRGLLKCHGLLCDVTRPYHYHFT